MAAISINQKQIDEKSQQVPRMFRIYGIARLVCLWLDPERSDSKMAFHVTRNGNLNFENFGSLSESPYSGKKWNSLFNFVKRSRFLRRWVVQEIAVARDALIYCGQDYIPWKVFVIAVGLLVEFETAAHGLSEVMRKETRYDLELHGSIHPAVFSRNFRMEKGNRYLVSSTLSSLCLYLGFPRDTIHSLLAIAKDTKPVTVGTITECNQRET